MVLGSRGAVVVVALAACGEAEVGWAVAPAGVVAEEDGQGCAWTMLSASWDLAPVAEPTSRTGSTLRWPSFAMAFPNAALDYGPTQSTAGARYARVALGVTEVAVQGTLTCPDVDEVALRWSGLAMSDVVCAGAALAAADGSATRFVIEIGGGWPWGLGVDARDVADAALGAQPTGPTELAGLWVGDVDLGEEAAAHLPRVLGVQGADCGLSLTPWSD